VQWPEQACPGCIVPQPMQPSDTPPKHVAVTPTAQGDGPGFMPAAEPSVVPAVTIIAKAAMMVRTLSQACMGDSL